MMVLEFYQYIYAMFFKNKSIVSIILLSMYFLIGTHFVSHSQELFPPNGRLFEDTILPRIDIFIDQDSLDELLKYENRWSYHEYKADFVFSDSQGNDTIRDIGFRLRGNTSRSSKKKSFKVSFNTFEKGRKFYGVEKLNLNGEHNDPSIVRSKFCFDIAKQMGIVASRANHIKLYINGEYFGLYINVEHVDEEFVKSRFGNNNGNLYKCLYPADLKYLGNKPDYYKQEANGRRIYDLKTNKDLDDYSDIAGFIKILHTVSDEEFRCELEKVFDVDDYLKVIVYDILTANWDDYIFNKNNFYLYHDTKTGKFRYITYDLDNTWGIDWFKIDWAKRDIYQWSHQSENRVLYTRILSQPEYRSKFTYIMKEVLDSIYAPDSLQSYLHAKRELVRKAAQDDTYRTLDYGFTYDDFYESYDIAPGFDHVPVGIMEFINSRRFWANVQLETTDQLALNSMKNLVFSPDKDSIKISLSILNSDFLEEVRLYYSYDDTFIFYNMELNDDGLNGDSIAGDKIYSSVFLPLKNAKSMKYYFSITSTNGYEYSDPACDLHEVIFPDDQVTLSINEFMASNDSTIKDDAGEYDDWIELYNYGEQKVYLGDKYLTDKKENKTKWKMPEVYLQPGQFLLFWADKDEEQGTNHTNFKLSAAGEYIGIYNSELTDNKLIDEYEFNSQEPDVSLGRIPDGTGDFQVVFPTPGYENHVNKTNEISQTDIWAYPNPFYNNLKLVTKGEFNNITLIKIYNLRGQLVKYYDVAWERNLQLGLKTLNSGIYFLNVFTGRKVNVLKIVKI
ncbi:MAG TPA: T9SS type A sorting domain-containing protein [Bacteroidetes bacterium]|nr:T9SS type A sorting domain-containing protein [Bacteroidota bacterium]